MKLIYAKDFKKNFDNAPQNVKDKTIVFLNSIKSVPNIVSLKDNNVKRMTKKNFFRYRIGDYRLGFEIAGDTIYLLVLLHRSYVYKEFP